MEEDRRSAFRWCAAASLFVVAGACSSPPEYDIGAWQRSQAEASAARADAARVRGAECAEAVRRIDERRGQDALAEARDLALTAVSAWPTEASVLFRASRAESDAVSFFAKEAKDDRNQAALSALAYAERAAETGTDDADTMAQLAWALGGSTHLVAMGERAAVSRRTQAVAAAVLVRQPEHATAHATLAILNLRLETLPFFANLMASGLPESSLEAAEAHARRAVAALPSREHRLILARILVERGDAAGARDTVDAALAEPPRWPRDHAVEADLRSLRDQLR